MQLSPMPLRQDLAQDRHAVRAVAAGRRNSVEGVDVFTRNVAAEFNESVRRGHASPEVRRLLGKVRPGACRLLLQVDGREPVGTCATGTPLEV
jgi:hypothetical protein